MECKETVRGFTLRDVPDFIETQLAQSERNIGTICRSKLSTGAGHHGDTRKSRRPHFGKGTSHDPSHFLVGVAALGCPWLPARMPSISDHQRIQRIDTCAKITSSYFISLSCALAAILGNLRGQSLWLCDRKDCGKTRGSPFGQPPNPIPEKQWCSMTTRMPSNRQLNGISRKQNGEYLSPEMVQVPQVDGKETPARPVYRLF